MNEYVIRITGEYDMIVLTPPIIEALMQKIYNSNIKELVVPAGEILTRGYMEYLARVFLANPEINKSKTKMQAAYDMIADQIDKLKIDTEKCFDRVSFTGETKDGYFNVNTNEMFYMLIKQKKPALSYSYKGLNGKNIKITLIYQ